MSFLVNPYRFAVASPFPVVLSRTLRSNSIRATSQDIQLPSNIGVGDLCIIIVSGQYTGSGQNWNTPSGWTLLDQRNGTPIAGSFYSVGWFALVMDGTEDASNVAFSLSGGGNFTVAAEIIQIGASTWYGTIADGVGRSAITETISQSSPSFASCSPGWGAADILWIASGGAADDDVLWAAAANYGNLQSVVSGAGTDNGCSVGSCERELGAASETPGNMTLSTGESWRTMVLAIRPAA